MILEIGGGGGSAPATPKAAQAHSNGGKCNITCPKGEDVWVRWMRELVAQRFSAQLVIAGNDGAQLVLFPGLTGKEMAP